MAQSTPNIAGSDAIFYVAGSAFSTAPSQNIWDALIDTSTWPTWNSFCPRVTIRDQPTSTIPDSNTATATLSPVLQHGTKMTFHIRLDPSSPKEWDVFLVVTQFQPPDATTRRPARIAWGIDPTAAGTLPQFLLRAERVHEIEDVEGKEGVRTEVRNWEVEVGCVAYAVRWMYGEKIQLLFETWVQELKGFVEGGSGS